MLPHSPNGLYAPSVSAGAMALETGGRLLAEGKEVCAGSARSTPLSSRGNSWALSTASSSSVTASSSRHRAGATRVPASSSSSVEATSSSPAGEDPECLSVALHRAIDPALRLQS